MAFISAVIITYNEESCIERCINSVRGVADEVIVVDSFSDDLTAEICVELGVRFSQHEFEGYKEQKNYATSLASNDWILSLDADEALSDELKDKILKIKENLEYDGYYFNRRNNYCGQWIKHSNWYPDRKLRLFNRTKAKWGGINPHDRIEMINGATTSRIKGDILHWVLDSYEEHIEKVNKFTTIAAKEYFEMGKKASIGSMLFHGVWRFLKTYFMRRGFLDGYNGFVISSLSAYTSFLKYLKLRQMNNESRNIGNSPDLKNSLDNRIAQNSIKEIKQINLIS